MFPPHPVFLLKHSFLLEEELGNLVVGKEWGKGERGVEGAKRKEVALLSKKDSGLFNHFS